MSDTTDISQSNKYPWESEISTKDLLLKLIKQGDETEKVDFKLDFNLNGNKKEKSELLIDISSIANSYSSDYYNYGFLILGVDSETKKVIGTNLTEEKLKTHIDEMTDHYLSPHVRCFVELYDAKDSKKWGAIIVKPGVEVPHVFINNSGEFNKGEVWVRKGSRKRLAGPEDYSRFFAIRTEVLKKDMTLLESKFNLLETDVRTRIEEAKNLIASNLKSLSKKHTKVQKEKEVVDESENQPLELSTSEDLISLVRKELPKQSPLKRTLLEEVESGMMFLESDEISWSLKIDEANKEEATQVIQKIQSKFENYYKAIFELSFYGNTNNEQSDLILSSVQRLGKYINKGGVPYDAQYIRYLPLITTLYIISMATVSTGNGTLLKEIMSLDLTNPDKYSKKLPLTYPLFYIRNASNVFDALHPNYPKSKWCDGPGSYLKQYFSSFLSNYKEIYDPEALFYKGEFLLTLLPVEAESSSGQNVGHISSGGYMFYSEAKEIIEDFLRKNKTLLTEIFKKPKMVLENFDEYAPKMGNRGMCWSEGIPINATEIVYPKAQVVKPE